jgi:hypothetical protein
MTSNFQPILVSSTSASGITLANGASGFVDMWIEDLHTAKFMTEVTAAATGSSAGLVVCMYSGMGIFGSGVLSGGIPSTYWGSAPPAKSINNFPKFADNGTFVTMVPIPTSSSNVNIRTFWYGNILNTAYSGPLRIAFYNADNTNTYNLNLYSDIS